MKDVVSLITLFLVVLSMIVGVIVYIVALPTRSYIKDELEPIKAEIRELRVDIRRLEQNYIDHLAFHVNKP